MKFGKQIQSEALSSNPEWLPFWLNYKKLKKSLKKSIHNDDTVVDKPKPALDPESSPLNSIQIRPSISCKSPQEQGKKRRPTQMYWVEENKRLKHNELTLPPKKEDAIKECPQEVQFFTELRKELRKISMFYIAEVKRYEVRLHQLKMIYASVIEEEDSVEMNVHHVKLAIVHLYQGCIRLENFAIMNYQAFSKILKKHDKVTGYNTRSKYMHRMVNAAQFANDSNLLLILQEAEKMFYETSSTSKIFSVATPSTITNSSVLKLPRRISLSNLSSVVTPNAHDLPNVKKHSLSAAPV